MSKHEKHHDKSHVEHKEHLVKTAEGSNNLMLIAGVALVLGLLIGAVLAFGVGYSSGLEVSKSGAVDVNKLKLEVENYVNGNLITDASVLAKVIDVNSLGNNLYEMEYEIYQSGEVVGAGYFYTVGSELIIGQRFNLDKNIEAATPAEETPVTMQKSDVPDVQLFIMSFCPYGLQAVDAFKPAIQLVEDKINFDLAYVIYSNYASNYGQSWDAYCYDEEEKYCSMHGINELKEDVRQMCIQKYQEDKLWNYMDLLVADYSLGKVSANNIESMWKTYAQTAGVDVALVEKCYNEEAEELLEEQVALGAVYGVQGSPTAIINDTKYSGARTADAFKTNICSAFNTAPSVCSDVLDSTTTAAAGSC